MRDDKDTVKADKNPTFPLEATNFARQSKSCADKDELFSHLCCKPGIRVTTQVLTGGIHPDVFISPISYKLVDLYLKIEKFGMNFYYTDWSCIPEGVHEAFFVIYNEIQKYEQSKIKELNEKSSKGSK